MPYNLNIDETISQYAVKHLELTLNDQEVDIFKMLHSITTEYSKREIEAWKENVAPQYYNATYQLQQVGHGIKNHEKNRDSVLVIPGAAAVLMSRRTSYAVTPENLDFMHSPTTLAFIDKLREELGRGEDGYNHDW